MAPAVAGHQAPVVGDVGGLLHRLLGEAGRQPERERERERERVGEIEEPEVGGGGPRSGGPADSQCPCWPSWGSAAAGSVGGRPASVRTTPKRQTIRGAATRNSAHSQLRHGPENDDVVRRTAGHSHTGEAKARAPRLDGALSPRTHVRRSRSEKFFFPFFFLSF